MLRLTNLRILGRYHNTETGKKVNIHKGRGKSDGYDYYFYLYRNNRILVPVAEFHSDKWERIEDN